MSQKLLGFLEKEYWRYETYLQGSEIYNFII